jgi:hypothetical protein
MGNPVPPGQETTGLVRHFGLLHATALNISMIVGAGEYWPLGEPGQVRHDVIILPGPRFLSSCTQNRYATSTSIIQR